MLRGNRLLLAATLILGLSVARQAGAETFRCEFNDTGGTEGWNTSGLESQGVRDGIWKLTAKLGTPQMFTPKLEVDAANQQIVSFRMRLGKGIASGGCLLFIGDAQPTWDDKTVVNFQCQSDGQWHDYEVDVSKNPLWKGTVRQLRFQPIYVAWPIPEEQRTIEIDDFRIPDLRDSQSGMPELIPNGGFEQMDERGNPVGWKKICDDPLPVDVTEVRKFGNPANTLPSQDTPKGKHCASVSIPAGKQEIGGWSLRIPMKGKTLYTFTCWAKREGKPNAGVAINEYKGTGERTSQHVVAIDSTEWKEYTLEFESHPDTTMVQIFPHIWETTGQVWFDDLSLRPLDLSKASGARASQDETPFSQLTRTVVTPHIAWGVPLAGGAIRVLAIPTHREVIELAQRLDIEYSTWRRFEEGDATPGGEVLDRIYYGPRKRGMLTSLAELKSKLAQNPQVILFGQCNWKGALASQWEVLPQQLRDDILAKVRNGAGLVVIRPSKEAQLDSFMEKPVETPALLTTGIPFAGLPVLADDARDGKWLKCFTCGKGRVAIVDFQNEKFGFFEIERSFRRGIDSPFTPDVTYDYRATPLHYEYYQSLLAKLVVWAGQKEGPVSLRSLHFADGKLVAGISNTGAKSKTTAQVVVRDSEGRVEEKIEKAVELPTGETELTQAVSPLKSGMHFADVWLKTSGKTLVWGSDYFSTSSDVEIVSLTTSKLSYKPGENIEGAAALSQVLPPGAKLQLELTDSLGRVLIRKELPGAGAKEISFTLPLLDPVAIRHTLKAWLSDSGKRVLSEKTTTVLSQRPTDSLDDFHFWFWAPSANNNVTSRYMLRSMYDRGFDVAYISLLYPQPAEQIMGMYLNTIKPNLDLALYTTGALAISGGGYDRNDTVRPRCLTSEAFRNSLFDELRRHAMVARDLPVYAYSLGDEIGIGMAEQDFCFSPTCLEYTRKYLQSVHGDLAKLNEEWGTKFATWEEVKPMTRGESKQHGNFAPWADHRMAMEDMYTNLFRECAEVIGKQDPRVRLGAEGITGGGMYQMNGEDSSVGYDFGKIIPQQKMWGIYFQHYPQIEYLRSFASPDSILFTFTQPFEDYPNGYYEDRWQNERVNRFVPWYDLFHGFNATQYWDSMGTDWYAFYSRDLRTTPWAEHITETIREINSGVGKLLVTARRQQNGIAIHYSPASSHAETILGGKERVESPRAFCSLLEDLGLQYDFISKEQMAKDKLKDYKVLILPYSRAINFDETKAIREFAEKGGMVIADGEAGVMDGHCKYVKQNMLSGVRLTATANPIWKYREARNAEVGRRYRKEIGDLLKSAGIQPRFRVAPEVVGLEVVEFTDGNARYLGLLQGREYIRKQKEDHTPRPVKIQLPGKYHVYSVRDGRYLGFTDVIQAGIEPAVAKLYALLPSAINAVELTGIMKQYNLGTEVSYQIGVKSSPDIATPHVFHLEIRRPDGSVHREYTRNLSAPAGKGQGSFRLALNDPKGIWTIVATDVASGVKVARKFEVR